MANQNHEMRRKCGSLDAQAGGKIIADNRGFNE
jgi:hypothetical protein